MPKKSYIDVDRTILDIQKLKSESKTDTEIMEILGLPLPTYRKYNARIHKHNKEIWNQIATTELHTEYLRLKESLEESYHIAREIAQDKDHPFCLDAIQVKDDARLSIVELLQEGPFTDKEDGGKEKEVRKVDIQPEEEEQPIPEKG